MYLLGKREIRQLSIAARISREDHNNMQMVDQSSAPIPSPNGSNVSKDDLENFEFPGIEIVTRNSNTNTNTSDVVMDAEPAEMNVQSSVTTM